MRRVAAALLAAALAAGGTAGCDRSERGEPMTSGTDASASPTSEAAGEAALAAAGEELAGIVRGIVDPVPGIEKSVDDVPRPISCKDTVGDDWWPQQQSFNASVFVRGDSRPAGREVVRRLQAEGWTVEDTGQLTGPQTQHWVARRDGYVVTLGSTAADVAALAVGGTTPCIAADGRVAAEG